MRNILFVSRGDMMGKIIAGRVAIGIWEQGTDADGSIAACLLNFRGWGLFALDLMLVFGSLAILDGLAQFYKPAANLIQKIQWIRLIIYPTMGLIMLTLPFAYYHVHGQVPFAIISFSASFALIFPLLPFFDACITNARQNARRRV